MLIIQNERIHCDISILMFIFKICILNKVFSYIKSTNTGVKHGDIQLVNDRAEILPQTSQPLFGCISSEMCFLKDISFLYLNGKLSDYLKHITIWE
jgi:hypothetical protein